MNSIYQRAVLNAYLARIEKLTPDTKALWGKMTVAQMMAHFNEALLLCVSSEKGKRTLLSMTIGPFAKKMITSEKPFQHNLPTAKNLLITGQRIFLAEQHLLKELLTKLSENGAAMAEGKMHPLFGALSADEWSALTIKHLDHHLNQFGA